MGAWKGEVISSTKKRFSPEFKEEAEDGDRDVAPEWRRISVSTKARLGNWIGIYRREYVGEEVAA
jgi:hypothetical protein